MNCIQHRLLRVSFIELLDFIFYQNLNKRIKILPFATSQIAHFYFFIKKTLKFSFFCKKTQNFRALGALPPSPQHSPPLGISGYAPGTAACFESFIRTSGSWVNRLLWALAYQSKKLQEIIYRVFLLLMGTAVMGTAALFTSGLY